MRTNRLILIILKLARIRFAWRMRIEEVATCNCLKLQTGFQNFWSETVFAYFM